MKILSHNITKLYGAKGTDWLTQLPATVTALTNHWNLSGLIPVSNMTFNYVSQAVLNTKRNTKEPVVLKISYDRQSIISEKRALTHLRSRGCIKLIDYNRTYNALLLQQAVPGITLASVYRDNPEHAIDCYIETMHTLHHQPLLKELNLPYITLLIG